ncbi:MAG: ribonuclease III [Capsulimonadaceae bacterium]|nr:ribonuclease III [Capsulimonadaceae bacterium]
MALPKLSDEQLLDAARERGIPILDAKLLRQALTHKSSVPEHPLDSNERLEFLGDAVLSHVIARYLFETLPGHNEGSLAKARAIIVCKSALADASTRLNVTPLLVLGATEEAMGGRSRASLIADAYEALVAVIAITRSWQHASDFILTTLAPEIEYVKTTADWRDPKTTLQEWCQASGRPLPAYQIVNEFGRPHDRTFTAEVIIDECVLGSGCGKSKKEAQQAAAEKALEAIAKKERRG